MSLCSTWVLATDGKLYEDPILEGPGWFLCFDDDDPPELVIKMTENDPILFRMLALDILVNLDVRYEILSKKPSWAGRCFEDEEEFQDAGAIFVKLLDPIPVPARYEAVADWESFWNDKRRPECVIYEFGRCLPIK